MEQLEAWQQETLKMKHLRFLVMRLLTDKKKDKKKLKKDKKIEHAEHIFSWRSSPVVTQQQVGYKEYKILAALDKNVTFLKTLQK